MKKFDLYIKDGNIVSSTETVKKDIGIKDGKIIFLGFGEESLSKEIIDAKNLHILPGLIDGQVHFREPGPTHKEDLETGSKAAILGGVTTFLEMPNTNPPTTTIEALKEKISLGLEKSYANFAFFFGASRDNLEEISRLRPMPGLAGVKIFLGSSTGPLLLTEEDIILKVFQMAPGIIAVHSENEELLQKNIEIHKKATSVHQHPVWRNVETALTSTQKVISWAKKTQRKIHILHVSTKEEMNFLKDNKNYCTIEVTPQHLTLSSETCYDQMGTYAQMNPPIRSQDHQDGLWKALKEGIVDVIGSDHAPHTKEEKERGYPLSPSGIPGVQTTLSLMLEHVYQKKLELHDVVKLLCKNPSKLYSLENKGEIALGKDADLVLVNLNERTILKNEDMASKCGYTPFNGMTIHGTLKATILDGKKVVENNKIIVQHPIGKPVLVQGNQRYAP